MSSVDIKQCSRFFSQVMDEEEDIIWFDIPMIVPFLLGGAPYYIFGVVLLSLDLFILSNILNGIEEDVASGFVLVGILSLLCMRCFFHVIWLFLVYLNTAYVLTSKRLILRSGVFGVDYKSIDHDRIDEIEANVNPIEAMFKVGSIKIYNGTSIYGTISCIKTPYVVFKTVKAVNRDSKADTYYPNSKRR